MTDRERFLAVLAANEDDNDTRMIFADWLDEHGEYDEANRQRAWPAAKAWMVAFAANCTYTEWHQNEVPEYTDHVMSVADVVDNASRYVDHHSGKYGWSYGNWFPDNEPDTIDLDDDDEAKAAFWQAWSVLTGRKPLADAPNNPFRCCY